MRPAWLVLSLLAHAAAVGAAVGFAVHAGVRRPPPPPRVEVMPSVASVPVPPAAQPLPPVLVEAPPAETQLPDVLVAEPIEPPTVRVGPGVPVAAPVPSLQRVVPRAPERAEPAEVVPAAAEPSATVEAVRRPDNEPPVYPEHERRLGHEGEVVLLVAVDAHGEVADVEVKTPCPHAGLNREALRAVRRWRFEPARRHGQPVGSETEIVIEFRLRER